MLRNEPSVLCVPYPGGELEYCNFIGRVPEEAERVLEGGEVARSGNAAMSEHFEVGEVDRVVDSESESEIFVPEKSDLVARGVQGVFFVLH